MHKVVLIKGDGIGPEVIESVLILNKEIDCGLEFIEYKVGLSAIKEKNEPLSSEVIDAIRHTRVAIKGPVTTPKEGDFESVNVGLRKKLCLYANIRPIKYKDHIDVVVVRENTEDLYSGQEFESEDGKMVWAKRVITYEASKRISEVAFSWAQKFNKHKVTVPHKANILKKTCGLFLQAVREVAEKYPDIEFEDMFIDNFCAQIIKEPKRFQIILATNLFGDIISSLCGAIGGSVGICGSANIGDKIAIFEPMHGSAEDIAGKNIANPIGMVAAFSLLLEYLHMHKKAKLINQAINRLLQEAKVLTADLGGNAKTTDVIKEIARLCQSYA